VNRRWLARICLFGIAAGGRVYFSSVAQVAPRVCLKEGIECNLGRLQAMATSCKIGDTVLADGFLKRCDDGGILIEPALLRDPAAKFIAN